MNFRVFIENKLRHINGEEYRMDIRDDEFVHFTTFSRAKQIIKSGKLLFKPPYEKFGTDTVDAVSIVWGRYIPEVQSTHIKLNKNDRLVAIRFKTNSIPKIGHREEVKWMSNVSLINPTIISVAEAIKLLNSAPEKIKEEDYVFYIDQEELKRLTGHNPSDSFDANYDRMQQYFQRTNI